VTRLSLIRMRESNSSNFVHLFGCKRFGVYLILASKLGPQLHALITAMTCSIGHLSQKNFVLLDYHGLLSLSNVAT